MPTLPGATPQQQKVYDFLHTGGFLNENKLQDADRIALGAKLPKGIATNVLMELEKQGWVKRVARGKAAGYYITKEPGAVETPKGEGDFTADDIF
jgi:predicted transcriptional regulator